MQNVHYFEIYFLKILKVFVEQLLQVFSKLFYNLQFWAQKLAKSKITCRHVFYDCILKQHWKFGKEIKISVQDSDVQAAEQIKAIR